MEAEEMMRKDRMDRMVSLFTLVSLFLRLVIGVVQTVQNFGMFVNPF